MRNYANPALVALPRFEAERDHARHEPEMEIQARRFVGGQHYPPFNLVLGGYGFEASRSLTLYDIEQLRDWCDRVLAVAKAGEKETA